MTKIIKFLNCLNSPLWPRRGRKTVHNVFCDSFPKRFSSILHQIRMEYAHLACWSEHFATLRIQNFPTSEQIYGKSAKI